jgi:hypothetical protein
VLTDDEPKKRVAEFYARSYHKIYRVVVEPADPARARILSSSTCLSELLHRVPALVAIMPGCRSPQDRWRTN